MSSSEFYPKIEIEDKIPKDQELQILCLSSSTILDNTRKRHINFFPPYNKKKQKRKKNIVEEKFEEGDIP